jgi:hypothetical protein
VEKLSSDVRRIKVPCRVSQSQAVYIFNLPFVEKGHKGD